MHNTVVVPDVFDLGLDGIDFGSRPSAPVTFGGARSAASRPKTKRGRTIDDVMTDDVTT